MPNYQAPTQDMQFILHDWLNISELYQSLGLDDAADKDLINAILDEAAKFSSELVSPLNYSGDQQGCQLKDGVVTTPDGFKQAYQQYCDAGWASLAASTDFGGQGLPYSLALVTSEMVCSANASWSMYPGLTHGAISALEHHANSELQNAYLPKLIAGVWTGTMCLTEAHCGSDLGLIKTKAEVNAETSDDGSYAITGSKIFISAGEHDMSENIIHLVLARVTGAPAGSAGISLFLVPKIINTESGEQPSQQQSDNFVSCGALEHKMGIKGSATCVINFDESKGYLIGEVNKGLSCMFTMMNKARLATGVQGYAIAELAKQGALEYAHNRLQMRSLSGIKAPQKAADPIIVHPDVKRMMFTQKAFIEGCRGLAYYIATLADRVDRIEHNGDPDGLFGRRLDLLTPICKAFMSEVGFESTNHAVQVLGGHGYIGEWELEQTVRDARIAMIYEGTNGIQALDFLGRKVLKDKGLALTEWIKTISQESALVADEFKGYAEQLQKLNGEWGELTQYIALQARKSMDEIGAAAFDFLMYSGYLSVAHILLQQANAAAKSQQSEAFKQAKAQTLAFYFGRILPRITTHKALIKSGFDNLNCNEFELSKG